MIAVLEPKQALAPGCPASSGFIGRAARPESPTIFYQLSRPQVLSIATIIRIRTEVRAPAWANVRKSAPAYRARHCGSLPGSKNAPGPGPKPKRATEPPHMTSRRSQLQEDTYFRVLRMLQDNPDLTQREIAERLGLSTSGLNYCLKALIDKGWVKMQNFSQSKNKFGYIYVLTPQGLIEKAQLTGHFLRRKIEEYEHIRAEIEALQSEIGKPTNL